ncbi:ABC transporter ATP-binding protein [Bacillus badius]|uniref:Branched-chain amino acid transport ATP-binding protein LivF n=1 Tax=Bacillus badius TaxID=1455 RepID=A0ABR5AQL9_BACBA|nr:ABC transporter ATP-binding protein [Bacillus badius]KIL72200.1 Branched-chain amino acid transport ATP-binding protein LivF [Bacillus badius]KIL76964.1 Branched-chain amino acid transport ATP-binding protein LivF [Bacillus badius]KZN98116.1 ABC transporter ATP-binding protein [Bacillus badius]KZR58172.1 ABC transporter ATP-binding protein [Bacillus badius]MED0665379.1 ABC transporter ATP-binding protein [Bacillus badius]
MLQVKDIHTYHGFLHVLKGISFELNKGEIFAIVGSNGAGKSTLLGTIAGIYQQRQGKILYEGNDLGKQKVEEVVKKGICLVPERRQIFDALSVKDNMMLGAYHRYRQSKKTLQQDIDRCYELFPKLKTMEDRPGGLLSGGEQQMLAIARGLMSNPKLMMLDEPSLGLAPLIVKDIMNILDQLRTEFGTTIILVEQNVKAALKVADRACVMERGEIAIEGEAKSLMKDPRVRDAYLGGKGRTVPV